MPQVVQPMQIIGDPLNFEGIYMDRVFRCVDYLKLELRWNHHPESFTVEPFVQVGECASSKI